MKNILLTALTLGLLAAGTAVVIAATDDSTTPAGPQVQPRGDISGPCDEAENQNDARCQPGGKDFGRKPEDNGAGDDADDDNTGVDISGPCDEAEHANDPECTGAPVPGEDGDDDRVDNSGPGSVDSGHDEDDRVDNSGPGSVDSGHDDDEDEVDNSGPGSVDSGHDDESDDDSSGSGSSGSGGGDDDSSGHGSGGGDD